MKAIVCTQYGPPDVLELKEVEKPSPREDEVLVRIKAASVNRTDCANMRGKPLIMRLSLGLFKPKYPVMGTEFAGEVEAVGQNVRSYNVGDKVFGFGGLVKSYAEYLVISVDKGIGNMPDNLSFEQAAGCLEGAHYAYNFINKVELSKGEKALVNGADGGIGSATVQFLHHYGLTVTAVCRAKNAELVRSLGADRVIDYAKEDFTMDSEKYDYVFDSVGKSTFGKCKPLLKPGGVFMASELGPMWENLYLSLITYIFTKVPFTKGIKVKFPYPPDIPKTIRIMSLLIEDGEYIPVIDRTYPLEHIADAFRYVETGQKTGNVVIAID